MLRERLKPAIKRIPFVVRLHRALKAKQARPASQAQVRMPLAQLKALTTSRAAADLTQFLFSGQELAFPPAPVPLVSVILVLFNRAELTFLCLRALLGASRHPIEVIVVDNASTDETAELFRHVRGVTYLRNEVNRHFLLGSNQAAEQASGKYLLFLNNDAVVVPGALDAAVDVLEQQADAGAVGAKLILPDGQLQEAGSVVWQDGTCLGYGRGDAPLHPQYMFRRDVDFCSGAFLLTRRSLFEECNRFDEAFQPAYYEETDYCLQLWAKGLRVVYEPRCVVHHFEFGSSAAADNALQMQIERRALFSSKHAAALARHLTPCPDHVPAARHRPLRRQRLLFIDERLPHRATGAGYPRANEMVRAAMAAGWFVTVLPALHVDPEESWRSVYSDIPPEVEVLAFSPYGPGSVERLLTERRHYYQAVLISRPTTLRAVSRLLDRRSELLHGAKLIYDAEAIFTLRDQLYAELIGKPLSVKKVAKKLREELAPARKIGTISTVSPLEADKYREHGFQDVHVISHAADLYPDTPNFSARSNILFVGAIHADHGPNPDAVFWFLDQVMPCLKAAGFHDQLVVAGTNHSLRLRQEQRPDLRVTGAVPDLLPIYNAARIFVAPTRFSAGVPLKVIEAAARGVPVVATSLIARQLAWQNGRELLVADTPDAFAACCQRLYSDETLWRKVRERAMQSVAENYSRTLLEERMARLLRHAP